ncbi:hypothetical protein A4G26_27300 [Mycobacterium kansasii]|nr:hypothetical protein A4G26_27300 [Mycobacterium kansasii]
MVKKSPDILRASEFDIGSGIAKRIVEKWRVAHLVFLANYLLDERIDGCNSVKPCARHYRVAPPQPCRVIQVVENREHA